MPLNTVVFYGSLRRDRQGIRVVHYAVRELTARGHEVHLADAQELGLPLLDRMYKEYPQGQAPGALESLADKLRRADAFVVVSGEYNHSIQPGLSNLLDHFLEEFFFRPAGIVCYSQGSFGGVRAAMQLRALLSELGMPSIPSILPVPRVQAAFSEEGIPHDPELWRKFSGKFWAELEWYAGALRAARRAGTPY